MLNNILFLSHGVQIVMLFFLVGLVLVFMKLSNFEKKLKQLEESQSKYISYEDVGFQNARKISITISPIYITHRV